MIERAEPWSWRSLAGGLALGLVLALTTAQSAPPASGGKPTAADAGAAKRATAAATSNRSPPSSKYEVLNTSKLIDFPIRDPRQYCLSREKDPAKPARRTLDNPGHIKDVLWTLDNPGHIKDVLFRLRFHSGDEASFRRLNWKELNNRLAPGALLADRPVRGELVVLVQLVETSAVSKSYPLVLFRLSDNKFEYARACATNYVDPPNFYPTIVFTLPQPGQYPDLLAQLQNGPSPNSYWETNALLWPMKSDGPMPTLGNVLTVLMADQAAWAPILDKLPGKGTISLDDDAMPTLHLSWPVSGGGTSPSTPNNS
ncbi:MAG: hypothetical protein ACJ8AW_34450, partial [Rhodopila sp.]